MKTLPALMLLLLLLAGSAQAVPGEDWLLRGEEAMRAGDYATAAHAYATARDKNPRDAFAVVRLSRALLFSDNATGALAVAREAVALDANSVGAHVVLALATLAACREGNDTPDCADGGLRAARSALGAALEIRPDDPQALAWSAALDLAEGRGEADALGRALVGRDSDLPDAPGFVLLARFFLELGLAENARLCLERTLAVDPVDVSALDLLGRLFLAQGAAEANEEAVDLGFAALERAFALAPTSQARREALLYAVGVKADALTARGAVGVAVELLRRGLALDPLDPRLRARLAALSDH